jgi:hypothetical protein
MGLIGLTIGRERGDKLRAYNSHGRGKTGHPSPGHPLTLPLGSPFKQAAHPYWPTPFLLPASALPRARQEGTSPVSILYLDTRQHISNPACTSPRDVGVGGRYGWELVYFTTRQVQDIKGGRA